MSQFQQHAPQIHPITGQLGRGGHTTTMQAGQQGGGANLGGMAGQMFQGLTPEQYQNLLQTLAQFSQQAMGASRDAIGAAQGTHDFAREESARRGQQQMAQTQQQAMQRGLGNTTIMNALQRGVSEDVSRDMRGIAAQEGQMLSGLRQAFGQTALQAGGMMGQGIAQQLRPDPNQFMGAVRSLQNVGQSRARQPFRDPFGTTGQPRTLGA